MEEKTKNQTSTKYAWIGVAILCGISLIVLAVCFIIRPRTDKGPDPNTETGNSEAKIPPVQAEGDTAPDFTAELAGGGTFTLSEQHDKVVLLNFWATWCGPCVREMPAFERLQADYGDRVAILAVNSMENAKTVDQFIEQTGYTFPIAYDETGAIGRNFPTDGIPYTLVIGKDGIVKYIYIGAYDADTQYQTYRSAIESVLSQTDATDAD